MPEQTPYVSFVIAGRNDDYGGDFNDRLTNSVNQLSYLAEKFGLPAEYVVVNYNPLPEKPPLQEAIRWPKNRKHLRIRIITVPSEVHRQLEEPHVRKPLPLYEYLAKNTGIRRAQGEYICAVNPDILFHPGIIKWLAKKPLRKTSYYRTDRCDFRKPAQPAPSNPALLTAWLKPHIFRIYLKGNHYDNVPAPTLALPFLRAYNFVLVKLELFFAQRPQLGRSLGWVINDHNAEYRFHCNVSGDFMLMHRDNWFGTRGYPENTYIALHTDSLFVVMMGAGGMQEHVLQWTLFHQDHNRRYDAQKDEFDPVLRKAYLSFQDEAQQMILHKKIKITNTEHWGLAEHRLEETEL